MLELTLEREEEERLHNLKAIVIYSSIERKINQSKMHRPSQFDWSG